MKNRLNPFLRSLVAFAMSQSLHAATGTWAVDASGLWSEATNWADEIIADGSTFTANFTNDITADTTVSLDSARTLNKLVFSDAATATPGSWIIDNNSTPANTLTLGGTTPTLTVNTLGAGKTAEISAVIASGTNLINKTGTGTLILSGANTYNNGMLVKGGVVIMNNASASVGGSSSSTYQNGSAFEVNTTSAFRQSAGTITINGANSANNGSGGANGMIIGSGSYGAYTLSGGTLEINDAWRLNVRRGQITQTGGAFNVNYTGTGPIAGGREFIIGSGNERGVVYATGGTTTITTASTLSSAALIISDTTTTGNANGADLTIAGTADWSVSGGAGYVHMTRANAVRGDIDTETGNLNLNGTGRLTTNGISLGDTGGIGRLNFNGGTLRAGADNSTFLQGLNNARIYSGGAIIDTNGKNITIGQDLEAPTGDGLTSIPLATGGSGYIGAPIVTITGGDGTGATAVADYDAATGTITGITITNPGSDYTSAPTVTLSHGFQAGGTAATLGDITIGAVTSGGLTKIGSGILTLSGSSTYTGATTVNEGTLAVTGSLDATAVEVKNNATLAGEGVLGGNVTIRTGGHQAFAVADTAGSQTARTITGSLTLEANTIIDLTAAVPPAPGGPYVLLTATGGIFGTLDTVTFTYNGLAGSVVQNGNNLELTVTAPAGFAGWIATTAFGLASEDQGPTDDPDNDGISNLMEYVLNGNPGTSSTDILPAADNSDPTDLIFTFTRREQSAGDTSQIFQYGSDLVGWTPINITDTPGAEVTLGTPADGLQLVTVKVPKSAAATGKLFGRLQVTKP